MNERRFLVTGARGFIGSWVVRHLVGRGFPVTALDIDDRADRLTSILGPAGLEKIRSIRGDINDPGLVERALREGAITHVIHTAGLQTPECRDRPIAGATVNVLGTLAIFEAVRACRDQVACVVYASSGAVLGTEDSTTLPIPDEEPPKPRTLYGAFKAANEQCARVYWQDEGIRSVGLRPPVVYGFGRDRGLTAGTTLAIRAAMLGQACEIAFSGRANVEYVEDVARCFVDCALKAPVGAAVFNMRGEILTVVDMISAIEAMFPSARGRITCVPSPLMMANEVSDAGLQALIGPFHPIGYREGARETAELYRSLVASVGRTVD
jgi:nucleoside-diphosphate-sugar epimerase